MCYQILVLIIQKLELGKVYPKKILLTYRTQ